MGKDICSGRVDIDFSDWKNPIRPDKPREPEEAGAVATVTVGLSGNVPQAEVPADKVFTGGTTG